MRTRLHLTLDLALLNPMAPNDRRHRRFAQMLGMKIVER